MSGLWKKYSVALLFSLLLVQNLQAVRSDGRFVSVQCTDGTFVDCSLKGDEHLSWFQTSDGTIMCRNSEGLFYKAPDEYVRNLHSLIEKNDREILSQQLSALTKSTKSKTVDPSWFIYGSRVFKPVGKLTGIVLLVQFQDVKFQDHGKDVRAIYDEMYNSSGYTSTFVYGGKTYSGAIGSMRDYWVTQSDSAFTPDFYVTEPVTLSHDFAYYGINDLNGDTQAGNDKRPAEMVSEACLELDKSIDLRQYDSNRDGFVDFLLVIFAGKGENDLLLYNPDRIWPHTAFPTMETLPVSGLRVVGYSCSPEIMGGTEDQIDGIGTMTHEMAHLMGLPDYYCYDTTKDVYALGTWSLMDYGNYNNGGTIPQGLTALERYTLGWLDFTDLEASGDYVLADLETSNMAYRITSNDPGKFLILEGRMKNGWYCCDKSKGLLVTAVDYNENCWKFNKVIKSDSEARYRVVPADNHYALNSENYDCYPYVYSKGRKDSLTMYSYPSMKVGGVSINKPLSDIRIDGTLVRFHFSDPVNFVHELENYPLVSVEDNGISVLFDNYSQGCVSLLASDGTLLETLAPVNGKCLFCPATRGIYLIRIGDYTCKVFY